MLYGIVPARAGSVACPHKNLARVGGVPLVARAVRTLREVAPVLCSTDDRAIADVARRAGACVPWLRPAHLATDDAPILGVVAHALSWLDRLPDRPEWLVMVQPTSPFVRAETIAVAVELARERNLAWLQSVAPAPHPPEWLRVCDGSRLHGYLSTACAARRQETRPAFVLTGAINVYRADAVRAGTVTDAPPGYIVTSQFEALDIDDDYGLSVARALAVAGACHS